jgi:hypothetical protein
LEHQIENLRVCGTAEVNTWEEDATLIVRNRGYFIMGSVQERALGANLFTFKNRFGIIAQQWFRVVRETDYEDFCQQILLLGGKPRPHFEHFYVVETD